MKIIIASDHGGYELKALIIERLREENHEVFDNGCYSREAVDYPMIAKDTSLKLLNEGYDFGILICGTGIGIGIAANKVKGIRAALCSDVYSAKMAKAHNDANIITLGARTIGRELAWEIVKAYIETSFLEGVHKERVTQINSIL